MQQQTSYSGCASALGSIPLRIHWKLDEIAQAPSSFTLPYHTKDAQFCAVLASPTYL
jgi:hypothetical protein